MKRTLLLCVLFVGVIVAARRWAPAPFTSADTLAARAAWHAGDRVRARELAAASIPALEREATAHPADPYRSVALAEAVALAGDGRRALELAKRALASAAVPSARHPAATESLLTTYAVLATEAGAVDEAILALDRLVRFGDLGPEAVAADERFAALRADPRFPAASSAAQAGEGGADRVAARRPPLAQ
jgi:hypothetical protein